MQAILALEDGRIFHGKGYGAKGECYGEVVFNTSITGYQEIFTDPSYAGQIVVLTNPEIGNYGTNSDDNEATRPYIEGLIVREFSRGVRTVVAAGVGVGECGRVAAGANGAFHEIQEALEAESVRVGVLALSSEHTSELQSL